jgi:hypothetical protein
MNLAQFLTTYGAKRQAPKPQAKAQGPKVLTLAQLQKHRSRFGSSLRTLEWREGPDPYSEAPGDAEEVSYAEDSEGTWAVEKRGDVFFLLYQPLGEDALVWTEDGWRIERSTIYRGAERRVRVTQPELFLSVRAVKAVASCLPSPPRSISQAKAQDPKVLTLAQLQKQSRQLFFPFPAPRTKR